MTSSSSSQGLPKTAAVAVQCVSSFAVDFFLQTHLYHAGVLWHLLANLFNYDYTLEESGVQANQDTNQQEVANHLAKLSLVALSRLGGYTQSLPVPDGNNPTSGTNGVEQSLPENPAIRKSLAAMLTPYIARKLGTASPAEVCGARECKFTDAEEPRFIMRGSVFALCFAFRS